MTWGDNLKSCLWDDFKRTDAALFSPREGAGLRHGIGVYQIVAAQRSIEFSPRFVYQKSRIAFDRQGLVLVGNLSEFSPDAERLLLASGYPGRLEVAQEDREILIRDLQAGSSPPLLATSKEHAGLIFRGQTHDLPGRPSLLFAGTSPMGILAATLWATQAGLAEIPAPPGFPGSPIEALVRLPNPGSLLPALSDLETLRLICGSAEYDPIRSAWVEAGRTTTIQVQLLAEHPAVVWIGDRRIEITESDFSRLLLLLIRRAQKEKWTTIAEAQRLLDGKEIPDRHRTLIARKSEIARLSPDPNFVETTLRTPEGKPAYRLRADIVFIKTDP